MIYNKRSYRYKTDRENEVNKAQQQATIYLLHMSGIRCRSIFRLYSIIRVQP